MLNNFLYSKRDYRALVKTFNGLLIKNYYQLLTMVILTWPIGDALRKWVGGGIGNLAYFSPIFMIIYLALKNNYYLLPSSKEKVTTTILILFLFLLSFAFGIQNNILYILSFLSLFIYILCIYNLSSRLTIYLNKNLNYVHNISPLMFLYRISGFLLILNSGLSVAQSILGRNHILSAGINRTLDSLQKTPGAGSLIDLRSPGLFTNINSSALFSCIVFALLCLLFDYLRRKNLITLLYSNIFLLSTLLLAISSFRVISRTFLMLNLPIIAYGLLLILTNYKLFFNSQKQLFALIGSFIIFILSPLSSVFSKTLEIISIGITATSGRSQATDSILARIIDWIFYGAGGGRYMGHGSILEVLAYNASISWFTALFGNGLGTIVGLAKAIRDEGYVVIDYANSILVLGEAPFYTLTFEAGLIGILIYILIVISGVYLISRNFCLKEDIMSLNVLKQNYLTLVLLYFMLYLSFYRMYGNAMFFYSFSLLLMVSFLMKNIFKYV